MLSSAAGILQLWRWVRMVPQRWSFLLVLNAYVHQDRNYKGLVMSVLGSKGDDHSVPCPSYCGWYCCRFYCCRCYDHDVHCLQLSTSQGFKRIQKVIVVCKIMNMRPFTQNPAFLKQKRPTIWPTVNTCNVETSVCVWNTDLCTKRCGYAFTFDQEKNSCSFFWFQLILFPT